MADMEEWSVKTCKVANNLGGTSMQTSLTSVFVEVSRKGLLTHTL